MSRPKANFAPRYLIPELAVPDSLKDGENQPAGKRFNVYRNNVIVSLKQAFPRAFQSSKN